MSNETLDKLEKLLKGLKINLSPKPVPPSIKQQPNTSVKTPQIREPKTPGGAPKQTTGVAQQSKINPIKRAEQIKDSSIKDMQVRHLKENLKINKSTGQWDIETEDLDKKAPKGVDPEKHESCVVHVKEQGHDVGSAHAICSAALKKMSSDDHDYITSQADAHYNELGKLATGANIHRVKNIQCQVKGFTDLLRGTKDPALKDKYANSLNHIITQSRSMIKDELGDDSGEILEGGNADGVSDSEFDNKKLREGQKHEKEEHTNNPEIAKEIAKDHLIEDPNYYKKIKQLEKASCDEFSENDMKKMSNYKGYTDKDNAKRKENNLPDETGHQSMPRTKKWGGSGVSAAQTEAKKMKQKTKKNPVKILTPEEIEQENKKRLSTTENLDKAVKNLEPHMDNFSHDDHLDTNWNHLSSSDHMKLANHHRLETKALENKVTKLINENKHSKSYPDLGDMLHQLHGHMNVAKLHTVLANTKHPQPIYSEGKGDVDLSPGQHDKADWSHYSGDMHGIMSKILHERDRTKMSPEEQAHIKDAVDFHDMMNRYKDANSYKAKIPSV